MEDDHLPAETRHRMMMYGQTPNRPYEERQKVPGDYDAMTSQGAIAPHSLENLGASDRGVSMFRRLLREGIRDVQYSGRDPKGLILSHGTTGNLRLRFDLRQPARSNPKAMSGRR